MRIIDETLWVNLCWLELAAQGNVQELSPRILLQLTTVRVAGLIEELQPVADRMLELVKFGPNSVIQ